MTYRVTTANVLEIAYLLQYNHTIVDIQPDFNWPQGIAQLYIIMEGENLVDDRERFLKGDQPEYDFVFLGLRMIERTLFCKQKAEFFPFWETWMDNAHRVRDERL